MAAGRCNKWILVSALLAGGYVTFESLRVSQLVRRARQLPSVAEGIHRLGDGPTFRLWVAGDSLGAGHGASRFETSIAGRVAADFAKSRSVVVTNVSVSGARMAEVLDQPLPTTKQDLIVVVAGSNDLVRWAGAAELERATRAVIERLRPWTQRLVLIGPGVVANAGLIPAPARPFYALFRPRYVAAMRAGVGGEPDVIHVDPDDTTPAFRAGRGDTVSAVDRFHLSEEGHRWWADRILQELGTEIGT